jgi:hypothetical protein
MNIPGNNNVPIIGQKEPVVLNAQIIITPALQNKLREWQEETGVSMITFGNVVLALGISALSKALENEREELDAQIERIESEPEAGSSQDS